MATPRKIRCRVSRIQPHGDHVYSLELTPERPLPAFAAGQFLHLTVDPYDPSDFWPESRAFSIASHPRQRDRIEIVYSTIGRYTHRMEAELREGAEVWVKLPYGEFVVAADHDLVLIAGGTGISAFTSFLRDIDPQIAEGPLVHLAYGARTADLLLYADEFRNKARLCPRFSVDLFAEQPTADASIEAGRISLDAVWRRLPDAADRAFYLSGPPAMIAAISHGLRQRGIQEDRIRIDAWE